MKMQTHPDDGLGVPEGELYTADAVGYVVFGLVDKDAILDVGDEDGDGPAGRETKYPARSFAIRKCM